MAAPAEELGYVAILSDTPGRPDAMGVVDLNPSSSTYATVVGRVDMPNVGDELHHFGWSACSACLDENGNSQMERRYLLVPGLRSSRIHILDTQPDPLSPRIVKIIEPEELAAKADYSRPHTTHCGPNGVFMNALGNAAGDGPGGIFTLDPQTFEIQGQWENDRNGQTFAYDFWWHLGRNTMITSEWATPNMIDSGPDLSMLVKGEYGRQLHFWDLEKRNNLQTVDLGAENQFVFELRPSHDPTKEFGFVGVVISTADLSASVWCWHRDNGQFKVEKVIEMPAEPADPDLLPEPLKQFGACPPMITDIDLSLDDKFLYISCWGTGEFAQFDVSEPLKPKKTGSVRLGGMAKRTPHPAAGKAAGGPQMLELSRDGRRAYITNSLYGPWDPVFYPDGMPGWMVKVDCDPNGGMALDPDFFMPFDGEKPHQVRLQGGDASSDSYSRPS
jgi:selenium-binding protein 1